MATSGAKKTTSKARKPAKGSPQGKEAAPAKDALTAEAVPPEAASTSPPPPAAADATPAAQPDGGASALAWIALALVAIPAVAELMFLAYGDGRWDGSDAVLVPAVALIIPGIAAVLAAIALSSRNGRAVDAGARTAALVALTIGIAVVATWGLWLLLAMLFMLTWQPSPQPCNVTCQSSGHPTCCSGDHGGTGGGCCGSGGGPCGSCGGSSSSGGSGSCCGSSSDKSSGSSGSCCGSSKPSGTVGGASTSGKVSPAGGLISVGAGLASGLALRRVDWNHAFSHHPDTPAYAQDVYRIAGMQLCIGCFTTFPLFLLATPILAATGLPGPRWAPIVAGLALASLQAISAAGLARHRATKIAVKTALGVGLALAVVGLRDAPWPASARAFAMLALAGLAWASTIPRRRRMARAAATG